MPVSDGTIWTANGEAPNNWWYSFNIGPAHIVAISTEIYDFVPGGPLNILIDPARGDCPSARYSAVLTLGSRGLQSIIRRLTRLDRD
jgi:hypothetical protein